MATKTTNYNLIKPDLADDADIRVINGNMDVLDNQLKSISDKANDVNNKLPLTGGTMTGAIKTTDNIYKSSNDGKLVLSGSTDASHGGRISLLGEKQNGMVKITADNDTVSCETYFKPNGYILNGIDMYTNTQNDVLIIGSPSTPKLSLDKNGVLKVDKYGNNVFRNVPTRFEYISDWSSAWVYSTDDLLIQGGVVVAQNNKTNFTLPRPYSGVNDYILYASDGGPCDTFSNWGVVSERVNASTIALLYTPNRKISWLTIGGQPQ